MKKTLFIILSFAFILLGACMIHTDNVVAAEKDYLTIECTEFGVIPNAPEEGYIFAGWYKEATCENVHTSLNGVTSAFAKFVPEEILSVKLQLKGNTKSTSQSTNMRLVSSVDSLDYREVGFEIYFDGAKNPVVAKTSKVYERIEASTTSGVEYNYSPKVIDIDSDYFVTATLINISNGNFDKNFYIRPYWKTLDGTTVYGVNRYVTVKNGISTTNINIPVKVSAELTTTEVFINGVESSLLSNASIAYYDGTYAHLNVDVSNRDSVLKSVNTIVVTDGTTTGTAQYRNLLTTHIITDSTEINADSTWYSDSEDAFVIATSAELYGFASLVNGGNTFAGKTVYLVADLYMNEGKATESGWSNANPYLWTPIGQGKAFSGNFDGGMHTISGIYLEATAKSAGLFGTVQNPSGGTATVKNLVLTNSYMTSAYQNFGSVAGYANGGNFNTIKSDAIVVGNYSSSADVRLGGFTGMSAGTVNIENCWFAGNVKNTYASGKKVGGFIGDLYSGTLTIKDSLNTGGVNSAFTGGYPIAAGFIGHLHNNSTATITDCLFSGSVDTPNATKEGAAIVGNIVSSASLNIYTSYVDTAKSNVATGYKEGTITVYDVNNNSLVISGSNQLPNEMKLSEATDESGKVSGFDFNEIWTTASSITPILTSFKDEILVADTSWYTEAEGTGVDPYILYDKEDLYGLAELSQTVNFAGKVIRLGADIIVNRGNAATWDKYVPKFDWTPIGQSTAFAGTFDGSDPETGEIHTISGIYLNTSNANSGLFAFTADGSTIQNLKLTNSYFYSSAGRVGSIAGQLRGTLNTVYSDAIVTSSANYAAGLAAMASNSTSYDVDIINSWFAGTVTNTSTTNKQYVGAFVAFGYAKSLDIINCLNTGTVDVSACTGGNYPFASGMLAYARCATTITSCLNVGEIIVNDVMADITYGALVGYIHGSGIAVDINNTYTDGNKCAAVCGYNNGSTTFTVNGTTIGTYASSKNLSIDGVTITDNVTGEAAKTGFANLDFDKYWTVTDFTPILTSFTSNDFVPDTTWFDESADTYILYNKADIYGFSSLVNNGNHFEGKTVKLGDDIVVNEGIASEWATTAPKHTWTPIGSKTNYFAGVFDGDMHTISGLYFDTTAQYTGLFGGIKTSGDTQATVQNLKLNNSYFESTASYLGSITGWVSNAQFDTIYSDVIVTCANSVVGGFMGMSDSTISMSNCWFDGTVTNTGAGKNRTAGFVGEHYSGTLTMTNCLNSGTVDVSAYSTAAGNGNYYPKAGGFFGQLKGTANVTDCLYTGEKVLNSDATISAKTVYGAFSGYMETGAVITVTTSYADSSKCSSRGYYSGNTVTGYDASIFLAHEKVIGADATTNLAGFDFNNTWSVIADGKVVLTTFENEVADASWYNENESEFVLKDKEDFFGFVKLSQNNNFAGKTVKLGTDIVLNEGDASEWATSIPEYTWTPIGQSTAFAGTFDGGMHTISGLYFKTTVKNSGLFGRTSGTNATIKNMKLNNSYFETSNQNVGSIVGYANGCKVDTVYSDAIVNATKERVGGFIGMGESTVAITNSWFAGTVTNASTRTGGFVGDQYSGNLSMSNCLNTGLLDVSGYTEARTFAGGLVGRVGTSTPVTLDKCLNTSNKRIYNAASVEYGAFTGFMDKNSSLTITNTYADSGKWGSVGYYSVKTEDANGNAVTTYSTINGLYGNDKVDTVKELLAALLLEHPDVIGDAATKNLSGFDFNSTWTLLPDDTVALKIFTDMKDPDSEKTELHSKLTLSELLTANSATKIATLPEPTDYQNLYYQGGCTTDGEYFYQAIITYKDTKPTEEDGTDKDVSNEVRVVKYNLSTEEAVWSDVMALNHANDITYNSKLDRFVVCHNAGNAKRVSYLKVNDAGKLEMDGGADLKYSSYSIDYNAIYDRYVVGRSGAEYFDVYDSNFNVLYSFEAKEEYKAQLTEDKTSYTAYITQGIACDDNYIYCVLDKPDVIVVYDWFGCFVTKIDLSNVVDYEPENISIVGDSIYVTDVFYYNTELFGKEIELTRAYVYKIDASSLVKDTSAQ